MPKKTLLILLLLIISVPVIFFSFGRNGSNREISKDIAYQNGKYISIKNNTIDIEIAKTPAEQQKGLSERSFLAENNGMLFPYNKKTIPNFWMKKMLIPIDIIWIADNKIIGIENNVPNLPPNTPDYKLPQYSPPEPIDFVLEVNAGYCEKMGIRVGDEVIFNK